jgi:uncharacterized repeat protein (TIGR03803 family)
LRRTGYTPYDEEMTNRGNAWAQQTSWQEVMVVLQSSKRTRSTVESKVFIMKTLLLLPLVAFASLVVSTAPSAASSNPHLQVLAAFVGAGAGSAPMAGLALGADGTLYGTTSDGGINPCYCGTVFSLRHSGSTWTLNTLHSFRGGDGAIPVARLLVDSHGDLFGTTADGGSGCSSGCGIVFELIPSTPSYTERILYRFTGGPDGGNPTGGLIADSAGSLYGLAGHGGTGTSCSLGCGVAYKLVRSGSHYTELVLHDFQGGATDGASPAWTTLVADSAGDLLGTTIEGGNPICEDGCGTAFELRPSANGYRERVLHFFAGTPDGARPYGGLTYDVDGSLYGTTEIGGDLNACSAFGGCGTVFRLAPRLSGFKEAVVYAFVAGKDAYGPMQGLVADKSGALYGASPGGGFAQVGVLFKLTPTGSGFTETVLHDFHGRADGAGPYAPLLVDNNGTLIGSALSGPLGSSGEVFAFHQ